MYAHDPMGAALDRHITGNYGEDAYSECAECDEYDDCTHHYPAECRAEREAAHADDLYDRMKEEGL